MKKKRKFKLSRRTSKRKTSLNRSRKKSSKTKREFFRSPIILYLVLTPERTLTQSPFQYFDLSTLDHVPMGLDLALSLPAWIGELLQSPEQITFERFFDLSFRHHIFITPLDEISDIQMARFSYSCVIARQDILEQLDLSPYGLFSDSLVICPDAYDYDECKKICRERMFKYVKHRNKKIDIPSVFDKLSTLRQPKNTKHFDKPLLDHFVSMSGNIVLQSVGFYVPTIDIREFMETKTEGSELPGILDPPGPHGLAMWDSFEAVKDLRTKALNDYGSANVLPPGLSLVITAPALMQELYRKPSSLRKGKSTTIDAYFLALKILRRQERYVTLITTEEIKSVPREVLVESQNFINIIRRAELQIYTVAVACISSRNCAPTIRLPFSINRLRGPIKQLEACYRTLKNDKVWLSKLYKLFSNIQKEMDSILIEDYKEELKKNQTHVKIVGNAPLEWLDVDGLPLLLRHTTSRIPVTHGDFFLEQSVNYQLVNFRFEDLEHILVIRSFDDSSEEKGLLQEIVEEPKIAESIDIFCRHLKKNIGDEHVLKKYSSYSPRIEFVDVSTVEQVIAALNSYRGNIVVFDCHGHYNSTKNINVLQLNEEELNTWELKYRARMPPIVILSACDTHSLQESHASSASGFLWSGALTVLATVLPISPWRTADFIGNFLYYTTRYFPLFLSSIDTSVRWASLVTLIQRIEYCHEVALSISNKAALEENFRQVSNEILNCIFEQHFRLDTEWFEKVILRIASILEVEEVSAINIAKNIWKTIPESMKYMQFGYPESIIINGP